MGTPSKRIRETPVDLEAIERAAEEVVGVPFARKSEDAKDKLFRQHFGCSTTVAFNAWDLIQQYTTHEAPDGLEIKHLLWALTFLKTYAVEGIRSSLAGVGTGNRPDERTVRDWCWIVLACLANLEPYVVSFFVVVLFDQYTLECHF
jgi:hypothetical protein